MTKGINMSINNPKQKEAEFRINDIIKDFLVSNPHKKCIKRASIVTTANSKNIRATLYQKIPKK